MSRAGYFVLGQVLKPQGIRGELKLKAFTDDLSRFDYLHFIYLKDGEAYIKHSVEHARTDAKFAYLKIEGIGDMDQAESLRGQYLYVDRENAAKLEEGAHYISDLVGLLVVTGGGEKLGRLTDILQNGAKDVYVVKLDGGGTLLFPSVDGVFLKKDIPGGKIVVDAKKLEEVAVYDGV